MKKVLQQLRVSYESFNRSQQLFSCTVLGILLARQLCMHTRWPIAEFLAKY